MKAVLASLLLACCFAAHAQAWPARPVRIVVAYPPGGGIDILARQLADKLTPHRRQPERFNQLVLEFIMKKEIAS